jgi:hypothetical protein
MAGFLSGLKTQAMAMIPQLIQTAEPQLEGAVVSAMQKMNPQQKQLFSSNLNKLNTVVQREVTAPTLAATPSMGGKKKTRRVKKLKKRTRTSKH